LKPGLEPPLCELDDAVAKVATETSLVHRPSAEGNTSPALIGNT
jgi:hypothetical protein